MRNLNKWPNFEIVVSAVLQYNECHVNTQFHTQFFLLLFLSTCNLRSSPKKRSYCFNRCINSTNHEFYFRLNNQMISTLLSKYLVSVTSSVSQLLSSLHWKILTYSKLVITRLLNWFVWIEAIWMNKQQIDSFNRVNHFLNVWTAKLCTHQFELNLTLNKIGFSFAIYIWDNL